MTNPELIALVNRSILLEEDTRTEILEDIETLDEEQRAQLEELLVSAQQQQDELLLAALKENPNLLSQVKADIQNTALEEIKEKEKTSVHEELKILKNLEDQINNLFHD